MSTEVTSLSNEKTVVENTAIDEVLDQVKLYNPDADTELIRTAYFFASEAHCSQKRKEGLPYITHLIAVANILAKMHMDETTIAVGLLHDTIEDTGITAEDLRGIFGQEVSELVEGLTKISKLPFNSREQHQAENFRRMFLATAKDVRVVLVKFADRLHNMRTIQYLSEEKRQRIALETLEIYSPLANLLGIGWIKNELDDLSFKCLMTEMYHRIATKVSKKKEEYEKYLTDVINFIEERLKYAGIPATATGRVKHYYSIYQKMKRQDIPFEQVYDILGVRIITDTTEHCYSILGLIHSCWIPVPGRFKDYIGAPKTNLYQSLHTSVIGPKGEKIECQIRTAEMEHIAEEGIASHWRYKSGMADAIYDKRINDLRDKIKSYERSDARDFIENIKSDIFPYHVYVYSPKGDVIELPEGSTALDYAYHIHTNVGSHCKECIIDGVSVPLKSVLQNGNTVEIITSEDCEPAREWLRIAKSQRARNKIKQWIKKVERQNSINLGKELLERELKIHNLDPAIANSEEILDIAKYFGISTHEDLFVSIGYRKISLQKIVSKLLPSSEEKPKRAYINLKNLLKRMKVDLIKHKEKPAIAIRGMDDVLFHRSKCCYPIPGDKIVGFITKGKGISIHRLECQNLESMTIDKDRLVDVEWVEDTKAIYPVRLAVRAKDRVGILAEVTAKFSEERINISEVNAVKALKGYAHFNFLIDVENKTQLDQITKRIVAIKGVVEAERSNIL
jgi:GTP pyrophosphokinase